jgi:hypothetical protein
MIEQKAMTFDHDSFLFPPKKNREEEKEIEYQKS